MDSLLSVWCALFRSVGCVQNYITTVTGNSSIRTASVVIDGVRVFQPSLTASEDDPRFQGSKRHVTNGISTASHSF